MGAIWGKEEYSVPSRRECWKQEEVVTSLTAVTGAIVPSLSVITSTSVAPAGVPPATTLHPPPVHRSLSLGQHPCAPLPSPANCPKCKAFARLARSHSRCSVGPGVATADVLERNDGARGPAQREQVRCRKVEGLLLHSCDTKVSISRVKGMGLGRDGRGAVHRNQSSAIAPFVPLTRPKRTSHAKKLSRVRVSK